MVVKSLIVSAFLVHFTLIRCIDETRLGSWTTKHQVGKAWKSERNLIAILTKRMSHSLYHTISLYVRSVMYASISFDNFQRSFHTSCSKYWWFKCNVISSLHESVIQRMLQIKKLKTVISVKHLIISSPLQHDYRWMMLKIAKPDAEQSVSST